MKCAKLHTKQKRPRMTNVLSTDQHTASSLNLGFESVMDLTSDVVEINEKNYDDNDADVVNVVDRGGGDKNDNMSIDLEFPSSCDKTLMKFEDTFSRHSPALMAELYSYDFLPRNGVQKFVPLFENFHNSGIDYFEELTPQYGETIVDLIF